MAFTAKEKARIKHFLSYPDWEALAASIQLGYPAGSQPLFLVEDAFKRLTDEGEEMVRLDLCRCAAIEDQLFEANKRLKAIQVGNVKMNPREHQMLTKQLLFWITRLADDLGVVSNPYSQAMYRGIQAGGSINASVG